MKPASSEARKKNGPTRSSGVSSRWSARESRPSGADYAAGAELLDRAQAATRKAEDRALAFLDADQQRQLETVLRTMMRELGLYLYFPDADDDRP
jgi:hypothetical protein